MKSSSFVITLVIVCGGIAGALTYLNRPKTSPPAPAVQAAGQMAEQSPTQETVGALKPEATATVSANPSATVKVLTATPVTSEATLDDSANPIHKSVDALLSAKSAKEKHDLIQQLIKDGQIDAAIAELKQRVADNPNNAQIPTTLGEAQINKVRAIKEAGGDLNEMGILAMQADQSFNAALKIDPQNWEANFVKASSIYYWPPDEKRDNDNVQRLASLIDQQETMTPNPAFVQTYVVLGNQYEKMGQHDKAVATWQLGLQKFPSDSSLLKKISGQ